MKKALILAIILFMMFMPTKSTPIVLDFSAEDLDAYGIAGAMIMVEPVSADDLVPLPKPDVVKDCKCNNGKVSYDGGTSFSDCPCITSGGKCLCPKTAKDPEKVEVKADHFPRVVLITQPSVCPPCVTVDKNIVARIKDDDHKKAGWNVGPEAFNNLQVLDLDDESSYDEIDRLKLKHTAIPSFFYMKKDGVSKIFTGSMSYDTYINWSKKN
jgi:hypothetical protein